MRLFAATVLSLLLLILGCAKTSQTEVTWGPGAAPSATTEDRPDGTGPRPGTASDGAREPLVRLAELEIGPAHLAGYMAAVREEMETSIRVEPGVLAIYCVA